MPVIKLAVIAQPVVIRRPVPTAQEVMRDVAAAQWCCVLETHHYGNAR